MAKIVLGIGTSHSPQLTLKPEQWHLRTEADKRNPELWYRGKPYVFSELVEERADAHFERELGMEKYQQRYTACQQGLDRLAEIFERAAPDVAVIFGDDQHESFVDDNMPAMSVYWGDTVDTAPIPAESDRARESGILVSQYGHTRETRTTHPCEPALGVHIIESLIEEEFDVARSSALPPGRHGNHSIGHAFGFAYRRIMRDEVVPHVPIFLNTYFPPNQPSMKRCYDLGKAVRRAIESWDSDKTVAVIASGGLTHFVIEEDLDQQVIAAFKAKDEKGLASLPLKHFMSGTSETRNWAAAAGAMHASDLQFDLIDYVPCYRSEAGTGCAMAFAQWA